MDGFTDLLLGTEAYGEATLTPVDIVRLLCSNHLRCMARRIGLSVPENPLLGASVVGHVWCFELSRPAVHPHAVHM